MGLLVEGKWNTDWYDTKSTNGEFVRKDAVFRDTITANGDNDTLPAEKGRYHLFVSLACPWAHRTLIVRSLKGLEDVISVTVVKAHMLDKGWELYADEDYNKGAEGIGEPSPLKGLQNLYEVYLGTQADFTGRVTVPILWDKKTQRIVNNESSEIIRILNTAFNAFSSDPELDLYPEPLQSEIDSINDTIYHTVNNGVYKAGFATTQEAYEKACTALFETLDDLDKRLANQRYLCGEKITEADWRLFTTLIRFDAVYFGHFKCNLRSIESYKNLAPYLRDLYQHKNVASTVSFTHIKQHYYYSHETINPHRVVPLGPELNFMLAHNRDQLGA